MRSLRVEPKEVKEALDAGTDVVFLDVRGAPAWEAATTQVKGARRYTLDELEARGAKELPGEKEIVAYCT
jgi:rhodanese-related sulfurtransferase